MDATAQAELVRSGEVSPRELTEAAIERIEALNGELNAVIHPLFEKALATEPADGPFRGVPFLLKDLACHSAGDPMHEGMGFLKRIGWVEEEDTWLARRFREAGFVFLGQDEHARARDPADHRVRRPTGRPQPVGHDPLHRAARAEARPRRWPPAWCPIAHASDGGGSIRIPASCCGLVGLKPSRGRVSMAPEFGDFMSGLVTELVVTRSVRDTAAVLEWVADPPPGEPYVRPRPRTPVHRRGRRGPRAPAHRPDDAPAGRPVRGAPRLRGGGRGHGTSARVARTRGRGGVPRGARRRGLHREVPGALDERRRLQPALLGAQDRAADRSRTTWSRSPGPWPSRAARTPRPRTSRPMEYAQVVTRDGADWWARPRPAADADAGAAAGGDRHHRQRCRGEPADADRARHAVRHLHRRVQLHRVSRPSRCRCTGPRTACRSAIQLVAAYGREDLLLRVAAQLEEAQPWAIGGRRWQPPSRLRADRAPVFVDGRASRRPRSGRRTKRTASQTSLPAGASTNSARVASTIVLIGFASANSWTPAGIDSGGTKADDANVSGKMQR